MLIFNFSEVTSIYTKKVSRLRDGLKKVSGHFFSFRLRSACFDSLWLRCFRSCRDLITFSIEFDSHLSLLGFSCLKSRKHDPGVDITSLLDVGILLRALALKRSCGLGKLRLQVVGLVLVRIFVFFLAFQSSKNLAWGA